VRKQNKVLIDNPLLMAFAIRPFHFVCDSGMAQFSRAAFFIWNVSILQFGSIDVGLRERDIKVLAPMQRARIVWHVARFFFMRGWCCPFSSNIRQRRMLKSKITYHEQLFFPIIDRAGNIPKETQKLWMLF